MIQISSYKEIIRGREGGREREGKGETGGREEGRGERERERERSHQHQHLNELVFWHHKHHKYADNYLNGHKPSKEMHEVIHCIDISV